MKNEQRKQSQDEGSHTFKLFNPEGKSVRVLSTSLGVALLANAFLLSGGVMAEGAGSDSVGNTADEPKLVAWSNDEVKAYFDKNADWSIPLPDEKENEDGTQTGSTGTAGSGGTTVVNHYHSGFGWGNLLLYHFLFNRGSGYHPSTYYDNRQTHYTGTSQSYKPRSYASGTFQNKPVSGSKITPKTSRSTGSISRRGTSAKSGSIGGKSSGFSSSGSHSSSGGGFGG
ncbi:hypothetical protein [Paenibacillus sp.]|jgi:hypothetical protein|uniref:hypothetical protein n=1 Tax=Paenibacillus sp. TaxID=58172 RepID=UPI002824D171|nr:hypothetical protein [Paenibacillus sp.]MDR0269035.1 hypothetical protein [Paenibacillus sp.]